MLPKFLKLSASYNVGWLPLLALWAPWALRATGLPLYLSSAGRASRRPVGAGDLAHRAS